jgi:tol-pal system protein YbgF
MKPKIFAAAIMLLLLTALAIFHVPSSEAANRDLVQLQTQVQALQDQMTAMKTSFDERMGVMKALLEQTTDNVNKMTQSVNTLNDSLQKNLNQVHTDSSQRMDQLSAQVQALNDSVDELKARMTKVSKQMDDLATSGTNLQPGAAPPAGTTPGGGQPQQPQQQAVQAPPPDILYNNALRDYNAGRYDLALGQFSDYMKYYSTTDLAGNAQFYLADIEYRQGHYEQAAKDYDKVLQQYPGGNKTAAAQLKKGFALLELGDKQNGTQTLNELIARYPRSIEAAQARDRLRRLNGGPAASTARPRRTVR